jgi:hypothetical protein
MYLRANLRARNTTTREEKRLKNRNASPASPGATAS